MNDWKIICSRGVRENHVYYIYPSDLSTYIRITYVNKMITKTQHISSPFLPHSQDEFITLMQLFNLLDGDACVLSLPGLIYE